MSKNVVEGGTVRVLFMGESGEEADTLDLPYETMASAQETASRLGQALTASADPVFVNFGEVTLRADRVLAIFVLDE